MLNNIFPLTLITITSFAIYFASIYPVIKFLQATE